MKSIEYTSGLDITIIPRLEDKTETIVGAHLIKTSFTYGNGSLRPLNQCIYRTMCYKVEDVIVKVLAKKHDQAAAKGTPDSVCL